MSEPIKTSRLAERIRGVLAGRAGLATPAADALSGANGTLAPSVLPGRGDEQGLEQALGGAWAAEGGLRHFVVERRLPAETRCGSMRVADIADCLHAAPAVDLLPGGAQATGPYMFFDLETTGDRKSTRLNSSH